MPTMWKCYHCQKEIAPNASTCPHCGGVFGTYEKGFMQSNARMDEAYEREKAGLPPKSGLGCAIPFALMGAGFVAGSILLTSSLVEAAEWKVSGKNNASVVNATNELVTFCDTGQNGLKPEQLYFLVKGNNLKNIFPKGPAYVRITQSNAAPYNTYINSHWEQGGWVIGFPANKILQRLKNGAQISFLPIEQNRKVTFSLKGSSVALDECFEKDAPTAVQQHASKVDILGLRTGMTYQQVVQSLPNNLKGIKAGFRKKKVTYFGSTGATNSHMETYGGITWRKNTAQKEESISVQIAPDFLNNQVLTISRTLFYETFRKNTKGPLLNTVLEALNKKYGAPYAHTHPKRNNTTSKGVIYYVFGQNEQKSWFTTAPYPCEHFLKVKWPEWGVIGSNKSFVQYKKRFKGDLGDERCGPYIQVTYTHDGPLLRSLTTTLVDVPLISQLQQQAFIKLSQETANKEKKLRERASGTEPKL